MTTQIRQSVFETNSSSSHSLTISPDETRDLTLISESLSSGILTVEINDNYGWAWERLYRPENKIAYLVSQIASEALHEASGKEDACDIVRAKSSMVDEMVSSIEELTGCKVNLDVSGDYFGVDSESAGVGVELFRDEEALLNFLFSKDSFVQLGNDNRAAPEMVPTDLGKDVPMYEYLYRDREAKVDGVELRLVVGYRHENVDLIIGDEVICAKVNFDASGAIADVLGDFAITEIAAEVFWPTKNPGYNEAARQNPKILQQHARNGLVKLLSKLNSEGSVNFPRGLHLDVNTVDKEENRYSIPEPLYSLTGVCSPATVEALKERIIEVDTYRAGPNGP